jgi:hypothetical protein
MNRSLILEKRIGPRYDASKERAVNPMGKLRVHEGTAGAVRGEIGDAPHMCHLRGPIRGDGEAA